MHPDEFFQAFLGQRQQLIAVHLVIHQAFGPFSETSTLGPLEDVFDRPQRNFLAERSRHLFTDTPQRLCR